MGREDDRDAAPGQIDTLMVFTGVFLVLFTVMMGILMLRLLYLPAKMGPAGTEGQIRSRCNALPARDVRSRESPLGSGSTRGDDRLPRFYTAPRTDSRGRSAHRSVAENETGNCFTPGGP